MQRLKHSLARSSMAEYLKETAASCIIWPMSEDPTQHLGSADLPFIRERLGSIDSRLATVQERLSTLEDRVDRRLQETRPIWESVLEQLKDMNVRQAKSENENKDFRRMFRSAFSDLSRVQGDLDERVDKIEGRPLP